MKRENIKLEVFLSVPKCEKCGDGNVRYDKTVKSGLLAHSRIYKCDKCGDVTKVDTSTRLSHLTYREVESGREFYQINAE